LSIRFLSGAARRDRVPRTAAQKPARPRQAARHNATGAAIRVVCSHWANGESQAFKGNGDDSLRLVGGDGFEPPALSV
jgi:hypothetical protein